MTQPIHTDVVQAQAAVFPLPFARQQRRESAEHDDSDAVAPAVANGGGLTYLLDLFAAFPSDFMEHGREDLFHEEREPI